jgi:hypothetical protein
MVCEAMDRQAIEHFQPKIREPIGGARRAPCTTDLQGFKA